MTNRFYFQDPESAEAAAAAAIRSFLSLACGSPRWTADGRILVAVRQMESAHAIAFADRFGARYEWADGPVLGPRELSAAYVSKEAQLAKLARRMERLRAGEVPRSLDREAIEDDVRFWPAAAPIAKVGASGRN